MCHSQSKPGSEAGHRITAGGTDPPTDPPTDPSGARRPDPRRWSGPGEGQGRTRQTCDVPLQAARPQRAAAADGAGAAERR
ncbi:hypothetical protein SAMN05421870_106275 [Streptomyces qinglanensis]|uniref:Uncharacterized protein n=1 Tax=Streptomyces qinglanensis TaxID=943816 RepID=A0A1H9TMT2_9ACTN|nr:hypothetical protein SAMN05421870_106275 [Streptomyces qinglanensis]